VRDGDAVIGIHPFLIGMPDGAADTDAILKAARLK